MVRNHDYKGPRQGQAERYTNSSNKFHQTWSAPLSEPLYISRTFRFLPLPPLRKFTQPPFLNSVHLWGTPLPPSMDMVNGGPHLNNAYPSQTFRHSSHTFRHCRVRLPGAVHLRDAAADVGAGHPHLHGVLLQPIRLPRHLTLRLRAGLLDPR